MLRKSLIAPLLAASAMALTVTPAHAGKADRAREAIAAAEAKIHTAEQMGAATDLPERTAAARAMLAKAKENLKASNKSTSINQAIEAQALADATIGEMQKRKEMAVANANAARSEDVAAAQEQAASAQQQALSAQQQAEQANARAALAQQQAANSAADANAARSALAQQQAQVETTVTTQQSASAPRRAARTVTRKTTTKRSATAPATTTTTTVRQAVN